MKHTHYILLSFVSLLCVAQGVRADDITISTIEQLNAIATAVNDGTNDYSGVTIKLANDLDYSDSKEPYVPIGQASGNEHPFAGTFDGQGNTISGITLHGDKRKGVFNLVTGTVRNLTISNCTFSSTNSSAGGVVASLQGGTIENCHTTASVSVEKGTAAGGIVGRCDFGNVTACTSAASVGTENSSATSGIGGVAGSAGESNPSSTITANISKCLYYGTSIDMSGYSGAIVGLISASSSKSEVNIRSNFYIVPNESTTHGVGRKDYLLGGSVQKYKDNYDEGTLPESISVVHTNGAVRVRQVSASADITDMGSVVDSYSNGITAYSDDPENVDRPCSGVKFGDNYYSHILSIDDNATGTANSDLLEEFNGKEFDVKLRGRTFYRDGEWNTFCLPFTLSNIHGTIFNSEVYTGVSIMQLDNTHFYYIKDKGTELAYRTGCQDGKLYLFFRELSGSEDIQAGTPYIVKWAKVDGYNPLDPATYDHMNPVFRNVTIDNTLNPVTSKDGTVTYTPTYDIFSRGYKDLTVLFLSASSTLYYPSGAGTARVKPCRAYFQLNGVQMQDGSEDTGEDDEYIEGGGDVKAFVIDLEDDETGIEGLSPNPSPVWEGSWYDLSGRKIANGQKPKAKGFYIYNGKKIIVQ